MGHTRLQHRLFSAFPLSLRLQVPPHGLFNINALRQAGLFPYLADLSCPVLKDSKVL